MRNGEWAQASAVASANGHTLLSGTRVKFFVNNVPWADIHYTVNNGPQQNIRTIHNADNTNVYILSGIPAGAIIRYFYTIGQATGAVDTAWIAFTM